MHVCFYNTHCAHKGKKPGDIASSFLRNLGCIQREGEPLGACLENQTHIGKNRYPSNEILSKIWSTGALNLFLLSASALLVREDLRPVFHNFFCPASSRTFLPGMAGIKIHDLCRRKAMKDLPADAPCIPEMGDRCKEYVWHLAHGRKSMGMIYPEPVSSKWQLFSDKAGTFFPKKTGCRTASGKPLWDFCPWIKKIPPLPFERTAGGFI